LPTGQRSLERLVYSYLALLEHETSLAYELLAEKCSNIEAKLLLVSLYEDTKKHANIMKAASQAFGQIYPPPMAQCEVEMGQAYMESLSHIRSIRDGLQNGMSLLEALESILKDEKAMSEEYVTLLHAKVRLVEEDDTALRRLLGDIASDEERHQELLKFVIDYISR
jgi:rubrerythrin